MHSPTVFVALPVPRARSRQETELLRVLFWASSLLSCGAVLGAGVVALALAGAG